MTLEVPRRLLHRGLEKCEPCQDDDPMYEAVNDTITWLFRELLETDTTLHKKVVGYLRPGLSQC